MDELLQRQVRRTIGVGPAAGTPLAQLLDLVARTYTEANEHQEMVSRSLDIMSEELHGRNLELLRQLDAVRRQAWVLENMRDAAMLLTLDGRISHLYADSARVLGHSAADLSGHSLGEFVTGAEGTFDFAAVLQSARQSGRWAGDLVIRRADQQESVLEASIVVLEAGSEHPPQILAVARDVTHRRRVEQQLAQAQKLESIGQLAAGVAHEINTPAQYVTDNLQFIGESFERVLADGAALAPDDLEFLAREVPAAIRESVHGMQRIAEIVRGIRLFAHPGGGEAAAIDLNGELESVIAVSRNEWKYVATLTTDLDPSLPPVPSYPGELSQVFLNLIVNAAHAVGDALAAGVVTEGRLHVSTRRDEGWVEVRVTDNGMGIPAAIRSRVFDPFFTTKPVGKGTGQGLAISHRIVVEKHRGQMQFESTEGSGTTFIARLPLTSGAPTSARAA